MYLSIEHHSSEKVITDSRTKVVTVLYGDFLLTYYCICTCMYMYIIHVYNICVCIIYKLYTCMHIHKYMYMYMYVPTQAKNNIYDCIIIIIITKHRMMYNYKYA